MMAAPPGSELFSKAMARASASRASMPAATPAPPEPTIAMSVSYCLTPAIGVPGAPIGGGPTLNAPIEKLNDVRQRSISSDRPASDALGMSASFRPLPNLAAQSKHSLDCTVCAKERQGWNRQAERARGLEVDDEGKTCGLLDRDIAWFCAFQNLIDE